MKAALNNSSERHLIFQTWDRPAGKLTPPKSSIDLHQPWGVTLLREFPKPTAFSLMLSLTFARSTLFWARPIAPFSPFDTVGNNSTTGGNSAMRTTRPGPCQKPAWHKKARHTGRALSQFSRQSYGRRLRLLDSLNIHRLWPGNLDPGAAFKASGSRAFKSMSSIPFTRLAPCTPHGGRAKMKALSERALSNARNAGIIRASVAFGFSEAETTRRVLTHLKAQISLSKAARPR